MLRLVAFLRAINVGGHVVRMGELGRIFEGLGFRDVETFIASGNVIFTAGSGRLPRLEKKIEDRLRTALGYEVKTFLRTEAEVAAIVSHQPFTEADRRSAAALCVAFLAEPLEPSARRTLMAMKTDIDDFHVHGREVYWLCRKRQSESTFTNARFEKTLNVRATFRGVNTVVKLATKHIKVGP